MHRVARKSHGVFVSARQMPRCAARAVVDADTIRLGDTRVRLRIRSDLKAELERLAKADWRSLANYLKLLLEAHVATMKADEPSVRLRGKGQRSPVC
jgi:hypothetical protein